MTIHLVPLCQFSEYHGLGWRICPGYDLKAGDYAATMKSPDHDTVANNKARAATSRNLTKGADRKYPCPKGKSRAAR